MSPPREPFADTAAPPDDAFLRNLWTQMIQQAPATYAGLMRRLLALARAMTADNEAVATLEHAVAADDHAKHD